MSNVTPFAPLDADRTTTAPPARRWHGWNKPDLVEQTQRGNPASPVGEPASGTCAIPAVRLLVAACNHRAFCSQTSRTRCRIAPRIHEWTRRTTCPPKPGLFRPSLTEHGCALRPAATRSIDLEQDTPLPHTAIPDRPILGADQLPFVSHHGYALTRAQVRLVLGQQSGIHDRR